MEAIARRYSSSSKTENGPSKRQGMPGNLETFVEGDSVGKVAGNKGMQSDSAERGLEKSVDGEAVKTKEADHTSEEERKRVAKDCESGRKDEAGDPLKLPSKDGTAASGDARVSPKGTEVSPGDRAVATVRGPGSGKMSPGREKSASDRRRPAMVPLWVDLVEDLGTSSTLTRIGEIVLVLSLMSSLKPGGKAAPVKSPPVLKVEQELISEAYALLCSLTARAPPRALVSKETLGFVMEELGFRDRPEKKQKVEAVEEEEEEEEGGAVGMEIEEQAAQEATRLAPPPQDHVVSPAAATPPAAAVPTADAARPLQHQHLSPPPHHHIFQSAGGLHMAASQGPQAAAVPQAPPLAAYAGANAAAPFQGAPPAPAAQQCGQVASSQSHAGGGPLAPPQGGHAPVAAQIVASIVEAQARMRAAPEALARQANFEALVRTQQALGSAGFSILQRGVSGATLLMPAHMDFPVACHLCRQVEQASPLLLMCDACEKAFHIRCLRESHSHGAAPFVLPDPGDSWYCATCSVEGGGKPRAPKYGFLTPRKPSNLPLGVPLGVPQEGLLVAPPLRAPHSQ
eukprot:jgi/Mesen1/4537/ME000231S03789